MHYLCKHLPIQIRTDAIKDFSTVLIFFPLRSIEPKHGFVHQINTALKYKTQIFNIRLIPSYKMKLLRQEA